MGAAGRVNDTEGTLTDGEATALALRDAGVVVAGPDPVADTVGVVETDAREDADDVAAGAV